jgi:8-oxo-dGTP pyrophosphatase MutT (NUDIX family)
VLACDGAGSSWSDRVSARFAGDTVALRSSDDTVAVRSSDGVDPRILVIVGQLRASEPIDEREAASRRRLMDELDRLASPFDRVAGPVHVTGSAVVVGARGTVLHRHKRLGRWMQPGGHLDPGETPDQAARREAHEETGLVVDHPSGRPRLVHVDVHPAADDHVHLDLRYLLDAADDADPDPGPGESPEVAWFSWPEALAVADASLRGALLAARR